PVVVGGFTDVVTMAQGRNFPTGDLRQVEVGVACVVRAASGAREVWCWGVSNGLGPGATASVTTPERIEDALGTPLTGVQRVATGGEHACAVVDDGTSFEVECWGSNDVGQLGRGTMTALEAEPAPVVGLP
ncbi:MAG: hypothetical protein AAGH15_22025, partial [Myxococcota bacterium]